MFFAGHMVKCHPVSSHIDLEAISMKMHAQGVANSLLSSHVISLQYQSKIEGFAALNMSTLILCHPCHPWAFPIQNGVFLQ
jgi:hypothetical protein